MQKEKETKLGMVLDKMAEIHKLLLKEVAQRAEGKATGEENGIENAVWVYAIVIELDAGNAREMKQERKSITQWLWARMLLQAINLQNKVLLMRNLI